ncbi:MAG: adenosine deaminase [Anaerolineae bacterium]|nr:adenosine deaminase [Anaerolineae bacterium]
MSLINYIQTLPKAELHVHLEGSVQPDTLLELAQQNGVTLPAASVDGLRDWYTYRDFDHFIEIFFTICQCLQTPDDFARIAYEYGRSMAENNIRYAEVTWTPYTHVNERLSWEALLAGINAGRARAEQEWGVIMRWITDISRNMVDSAATVTEWATSPEAREGGVVALGLGGPEVNFPPELFTDAFQIAVDRGLHSNPHAGETIGPESIWGAIRALKAERIGHGVRAIEDPALIAYLAEHQIPLEVNPTSNICLGVFPSYAEHSLRRLVDAGVCVTINSDDPALFNTTLTDEYRHAIEDCDLSLQELETTALNAVRASYLPEDDKAAMLATFQAEYSRLRAQYDLS